MATSTRSHHAFHVPSDITDLCVFGGLDFKKWRFDKLCKSSRNFGFSYAGRAFENNVFRRYFLFVVRAKPAASVTVAQRHRHDLFCLGLTDYIFIQLVYYLSRVNSMSKHLHRQIGIGKNTYFACNQQSFFCYFLRGKLCFLYKSFRRRQSVIAAAADCANPSGSGSITSPLPLTIRKSFLSATIIMASSLCIILSLLQSCASSTALRVKFPLYFVEHCFEFFRQRKGVRHRTRKTHHDLAVVNASHLDSVALQHRALPPELPVRLRRRQSCRLF